MLGGVLPPIVAHLLGDISEFSAAMGEARAELTATELKGASSFTKLASIGKAAFLGLSVAAVGIGAAAVHMATGFEAAMEQVHTQAGASQVEVDRLKQKVLDIAPTVGIGPEKLAESLYHVESAGFRGQQALDIMTQAAKESRIGNANLEDVTQALIGTMASGIGGIHNAAEAQGYLNATVGIGDMRMQDLAQSISSGIMPVMASAGLTINDFGAAMATITDNATSPVVAATHLRMTIALMEAPTKKAMAALNHLGMGSFQLAHDMRQPNGLLVAVTDLKKHLATVSSDDAADSISAIFGGGRSSATIHELLGEFDRLKSKYPQLSAGAHSYAEAWRATQATFKQQVAQLEASLQTLGVKLGLWLIPWVEKAVRSLLAMGSWMMKHKTLVETLATVIGGVLLVAIGAWIVSLGMLAVANIAATWEILLIIAAIIAVVAAVIYVWQHWSTIWGWIKDHAIAVWQAIAAWFKGAWHTVTDPIVGAWNWVHDKTLAVWNGISGWFKKWWPLLLVIFMPWLALIIAVWTRTHDTIERVTRTVWNAVTGFLRTTFGLIGGVTRAAWALVEKYVLDPINRILTRVGQVGNSILTVLQKGFGVVYGWLSGQANSWWNIGVSIVQGLINGVGSGAGALADTVKNLANDALQASKNFLGINSPSRKFAEIGDGIVEGKALGITRSTRLAVDATLAMSRKVAAAGAVARQGGGTSSLVSQVGAVNPGLLVAGGAAASTGQPILVTVEAKVDEGVLFRGTQRASLRYQNRNASPAFSR